LGASSTEAGCLKQRFKLWIGLVHAGTFVSSNDIGRRSIAWLAGDLVLLVMWVYFALKVLLLV
jgi:hypothetical protein